MDLSSCCDPCMEVCLRLLRPSFAGEDSSLLQPLVFSVGGLCEVRPSLLSVVWSESGVAQSFPLLLWSECRWLDPLLCCVGCRLRPLLFCCGVIRVRPPFFLLWWAFRVRPLFLLWWVCRVRPFLIVARVESGAVSPCDYYVGLQRCSLSLQPLWGLIEVRPLLVTAVWADWYNPSPNDCWDMNVGAILHFCYGVFVLVSRLWLFLWLLAFLCKGFFSITVMCEGLHAFIYC